MMTDLDYIESFGEKADTPMGVSCWLKMSCIYSP